ncbi:MAG: diguanylate cyclase, partial [Comamonadaceae bacterium]
MLMSMLGLAREAAAARRVGTGLAALALLVLAIGWMLTPGQALALSSAVAFGIGLAMLVIVLRRALRGDPLGWITVAGVGCMLVALGGLSLVALEPSMPWPVHAISATAGMAYLSVMALALWGRYSYLLELSEVMRHGPSYDPVTRMRSHSETGQMVGDMFFRREGSDDRPIGVIAVCIANLYALENLHGRAAFNHALFIYAGRLRRCVPEDVEMGRLGDDGFLLMVRNAADLQRLVELARLVRQRLGRSVILSTSRDVAGLERADTGWVAEVGVGVLVTSTQVRPSQAISTARAMARTAWSYGSRLAYFDQELGRIAELPLHDGDARRGARWMAAA